MGASAFKADKTRIIAVITSDTSGEPLGGVRVHVNVKNVPAGSFLTGTEKGSGSVEISEEVDPVRLDATYQGLTATATIGKGVSAHTFTFQRSGFKTAARIIAEARCPDGTVGIPCVQCNIGGILVRLCV